uniref:(S)-hydroxynitrile lyase n=1 Tax=Populus trichocarpa TaxID=3694 RepID=A0A2K1ZNT1_POPTR|eukprot:XP_002310759.3 salicylic acid-binding protein 2 [Populus trichocarpa]
MAGINLPRFSLSPKSGSKSRIEMLFNSLSPSVKPILYPLEICNRQDRLFLFPKPATPSQKLLSTGVSPIACAKLPSNFKTQRHFVLVHGACHGAWCWYKVSAQLKSAGHNVTALDMAASGVHPKQVHELHSFEDYFEPLMEFMESLPPEERVVLVGHSMSGICISVAMERFPEKISAAVFAAAVMPGPDLSFKAIAEKSSQTSVSYMDTQYVFGNGPGNPPTAVVLGPNYMASRFYHLSPPEDLTLATLLVRPFPIYSSLETEKAVIVTKEKYGSVRRIYIVCDQEKDPRQTWMIENNPVDEVMVISGSDHMAMFSKPQELCSCLLEIGDKYL